MDLSSISIKIPSSQTSASKSQDETRLPQSRVTRQQSVSSASRMPGSPSKNRASSQMVSARFYKQLEAFMDHQRQLFDEERTLWRTERTELHERISHLERSLRGYQAVSSSQVASPIDRNGSEPTSRSWNQLSTNGLTSGRTSASTTGDEIWRGPQNDVQPTRTFSNSSDSSNQPATQSQRMPSIPENAGGRERKVSISEQPALIGASHKPSVNLSKFDKHLDGINFKTSGLPPQIFNTVMSPQSLSRSQTSSPSRISPGHITLPSIDPYKRDAGHTPLEPRPQNLPDEVDSDYAPTPTQPDPELPPLNPHTVKISKPPSERQDSYFPIAEETHSEPDDDDPALTGPLALTNNREDKSFLNELDTKLLQAARSALEGRGSAGGDDEDKENSKEGEEQHPPLRLKQSLNFGSRLGERGRGFEG